MEPARTEPVLEFVPDLSTELDSIEVQMPTDGKKEEMNEKHEKQLKEEKLGEEKMEVDQMKDEEQEQVELGDEMQEWIHNNIDELVVIKVKFDRAMKELDSLQVELQTKLAELRNFENGLKILISKVYVSNQVEKNVKGEMEEKLKNMVEKDQEKQFEEEQENKYGNNPKIELEEKLEEEPEGTPDEEPEMELEEEPDWEQKEQAHMEM